MRIQDSLTDRLNNGGLVTDGMLHYSQEKSCLFYIHYYNNKFICFDTNLSLKYSGTTIDTFSAYQIKAAGFKTKNNGRYYTTTGPKRFVNTGSCISGDKIFIESNIIADNEEKRNFNSNAVIDVYGIATGTYLYSFYIPNYKGIQSRHFKVYDDLIACIYGKTVLLFKLSV